MITPWLPQKACTKGGSAMTFQQLSVAVEVAKYASFNQAAERLYMHQSNVSNIIKQLEDELGVQIFLRTKKGVSVTNDGQEFLSYAEEIIGKMNFVEDLYAVRNRCHKQYFAVSSMRAFFLSSPIIQLEEQIMEDCKHEPIYIRLKKQSFPDVLDDVQYCRSELGIVFLLKSNVKSLQQYSSIKNLDFFKLGESQISVVMREGHPALLKENMDRITDYPYIIAEEKENFGRFYDDSSPSISQFFQNAPKCIISVNESAASQDIIAGTNGFFLSTTPWQHGQNYYFSSIPLNGEDDILSHYYVTRKNSTLSPLAGLYIKELKKMFEHL